MRSPPLARAGAHHRAHPSVPRWRVYAGSPRFMLAAAMLTVAMLFGGGGSPSAFAELIVQIAAIVLLCASVWLPRNDARRNPTDWLLAFGAVCLVALPLLQLMPLPPSLWHALPGRELEIDALRLVGAADAWRPLSMSPYRTLASLLSLLPPLAMLLFVCRLSVEERSGLFPLLAALGCASAVLGVLQLAAGESGAFRIYSTANLGFLNGFQANRNQEADVLLIAALAAAAMAALRPEWFRTVGARVGLLLVLLLLLLSVVLTGSRAGTALVAVAAVGGYLLLGWARGHRRAQLTALAAFVLLAAGAAVALRDNAMLGHTWERFTTSTREGRTSEIWPDAMFAMRQYWPFGTGVGTFVPVFQTVERLEVVDQTVANRAHNDYLELVIEAGVAGGAILMILLIGASVRTGSILVREDRAERRTHALFALFAGLVLALHSVVDYPMRSMSLAVVAGMVVGLLSRVARSRVDRDVRD